MTNRNVPEKSTWKRQTSRVNFLLPATVFPLCQHAISQDDTERFFPLLCIYTEQTICDVLTQEAPKCLYEDKKSLILTVSSASLLTSSSFHKAESNYPPTHTDTYIKQYCSKALTIQFFFFFFKGVVLSFEPKTHCGISSVALLRVKRLCAESFCESFQEAT